MVSKQQQSSSYHNPNLISTPSQSSPSSRYPTQQQQQRHSQFEMNVPEHLEALGSQLTVRIRRLSHLSSSLNGGSSSAFQNGSESIEGESNPGVYLLQLGIYERHGNGDFVILTQQRVPTISTNWQEVSS